MEELIQYLEERVMEFDRKAQLAFSLQDSSLQNEITGRISAYKEILTFVQSLNNKQ